MRTVPAPPPGPLLWTEGKEIVNEIQMAPDDYVLWLKGMFDTIGDRVPTLEEWHRFREQNIMQVGDVVMRRVEEREIAQREKMRRAKEEAEITQKELAYRAYAAMQQYVGERSPAPPVISGSGISGDAVLTGNEKLLVSGTVTAT